MDNHVAESNDGLVVIRASPVGSQSTSSSPSSSPEVPSSESSSKVNGNATGTPTTTDSNVNGNGNGNGNASATQSNANKTVPIPLLLLPVQKLARMLLLHLDNLLPLVTNASATAIGDNQTVRQLKTKHYPLLQPQLWQ